MYIEKISGYFCIDDLPVNCEKGLLDTYDPPTFESQNYKNWIAELDLRTCENCRLSHGKIYLLEEIPNVEPPLHPNCRCEIKAMKSVLAGQGTKDGDNGADWWLKTYGVLPDYYVTEDEAKSHGWRRGKPPVKYVLIK